MSGSHIEISHRILAMLRAVAARRATMSASSEPDLFIDGVACCDQTTARGLAHAGLIRPSGVAVAGTPVLAELTEEGISILASNVAA